MTRLAEIVNPKVLAESGGARAMLRVSAPEAWLDEGCDLEVEAPQKLVCARCEGGGCDGCARSGAFAAPVDAGLRVLRATLPPGSSSGAALRIVHPFGAEASIEQLILEVRPGEASKTLARIPRPESSLAISARARERTTIFVAFLMTLVAAAVAWAVQAIR